MNEIPVKNLAARLAGCAAENLLAFRELPDGGVVVITAAGSKFKYTQAEIENMRRWILDNERPTDGERIGTDKGMVTGAGAGGRGSVAMELSTDAGREYSAQRIGTDKSVVTGSTKHVSPDVTNKVATKAVDQVGESVAKKEIATTDRERRSRNDKAAKKAAKK